jgi:Rrf2 family protein
MKISTKGRYALRLMMELALNGNDTPISIKEIAVRQGISDKYLEQIISMMSSAGYVRSIRGAGGGYILTETPDKYTVGMILRQTEGSLAPVACVDENNPCDRVENCATTEVWRRLNTAINDVVDNITLQDLIEWR